jgi:hypothetical protein
MGNGWFPTVSQGPLPKRTISFRSAKGLNFSHNPDKIWVESENGIA